jgi:PDZ domain-containing protein
VTSLLRPSRILALLVVAAALTAAVLWLVPSDSYLLLPDPAHPVAPLVKVPGERARPTEQGGIYFVDVIIRRAKLLEQLFPSIHSGASLIPSELVNPPGVDDTARRKADLREMRRSQSIAAAVALRALGYKVVARPTGVLVSQISADGPAAGKLVPTDVIVAVDGVRVRTPAALRRQMRKHRPGDLVRFTVRRQEALRVVVVKTIADPTSRARAIVGIRIDQSADIKLPIKVTIDARGVGGPSAGLAFALDVMEELGRDVDRGYRVAATGEIGLDGSVGPIGGVQQKAIGARKGDVDVFLVPAGDNALEARRHAGEVRVIAVQSFPQALRALATLPRKD